MFVLTPRAYVEFYRTSQDSGVLPEVSLALLLAQQKSRLELSVYPTELIEKCAGNRSSTPVKYAGYCFTTTVAPSIL